VKENVALTGTGQSWSETGDLGRKKNRAAEGRRVPRSMPVSLRDKKTTEKRVYGTRRRKRPGRIQ